MTSATDSPRYMVYRIRAVVRALGTSLSQVGPGISARIRNMEFLLLKGITAMTNTSTPMPPTQWVRQRQKFMHLGSPSISLKIVEPVVVKPDTTSKNASSNRGMQPESRKGSAPNTDHRIQASATIRNPSLA